MRQFAQAGGDGGGRGRPDDLAKPVFLDPNVELTEFILFDDEAVDRHGVEQLIGQQATVDRRRDPVGTVHREEGVLALHSVYRQVFERIGERWVEPFCVSSHVTGQEAVSRAEFDDSELG